MDLGLVTVRRKIALRRSLTVAAPLARPKFRLLTEPSYRNYFARKVGWQILRTAVEAFE
jgi:hypothetical protein